MALINCPECGREVSDQAEACPRCAYPIAKKLAISRGGPPGPAPAPASEGGPENAEGPEPPAPGGAEQTVWAGSPSQVVNLKPFLGWLLLTAIIVAAPVLINTYLGEEFGEDAKLAYWGLVLLVIPFLAMAWKWLVVSCWRYELTSERIKLRSGVISRQHEVVELYRVKDVRLERPIFMRLCGLGHVTAITSDKSQPTVTFYAVHRPAELMEELRRNVEACRVRRRVREVDID